MMLSKFQIYKFKLFIKFGTANSINTYLKAKTFPHTTLNTYLLSLPDKIT